jgi:dTMP kinase
LSTIRTPGGIKRGPFITLEGPDGSGKSTQFRLLSDRLTAAGFTVVESAEPGGTPIGRQIRRILLDAANRDLAPMTELLLMFAARAQNVEQWILPALKEGKIVLSDRFTDSTLAYQGAARGLGAEIVRQVDRIACHGLVPDLTICVDVDTETGLARAHRRNRDSAEMDESRIDREAVEFHRKVRDAYFALAVSEPKRVRMIDGNKAPELVAESVWAEVSSFLASVSYK